jgi:1-aminocyclopropane-1-carboxylate deaminase
MVTIPDGGLIEPLNTNWYYPHVQGIDMLRLDLLHPEVSGNKWFKLKYNIEQAKQLGHTSILTFGGAYSNHLAATAAACKHYGMSSIGIVRGKDAEDDLNPTLRFCVDNGMEIIFVSREEYGLKEDAEWQEKLQQQYNNVFIVPEGGANDWGRLGATEIAAYIPNGYTHVCVSVGTGTTMEGLRNGLTAHIHVLGYAPMKGGSYLEGEIASHVNEDKNANWQLFDQWHFGGFGKSNEALITFMNGFFEQTGIPLDVVYTAKMMYGLQEQLQAGFFAADAKILCVHSGGLQGNASVKQLLTY